MNNSSVSHKLIYGSCDRITQHTHSSLVTRTLILCWWEDEWLNYCFLSTAAFWYVTRILTQAGTFAESAALSSEEAQVWDTSLLHKAPRRAGTQQHVNWTHIPVSPLLFSLRFSCWIRPELAVTSDFINLFEFHQRKRECVTIISLWQRTGQDPADPKRGEYLIKSESLWDSKAIWFALCSQEPIKTLA